MGFRFWEVVLGFFFFVLVVARSFFTEVSFRINLVGFGCVVSGFVFFLR